MTAPLSQPSFWILTVLAAGRCHGYEILRHVDVASEGRASLKVPTMYAALERLQTEGLITADGEEIVGGRARRYFVISDEGQSRLLTEVDALEQATRTARVNLTQHKFAFVTSVGHFA